MQHALQVEILKELMTQLDEGRNIDAGIQYRMPTRLTSNAPITPGVNIMLVSA